MRKADEERARQQNGGAPENPQADPQAQASNFPPSANRPQLPPPMGYGPGGGQVPPQYSSGVDQMYQAGNSGQVYPSYNPQSPYGQGHQM